MYGSPLMIKSHSDLMTRRNLPKSTVVRNREANASFISCIPSSNLEVFGNISCRNGFDKSIIASPSMSPET